MALTVVDASAIAALLFNEPSAEGVVERLGEGPFVAPALLRNELANVCLNKCRRFPDSADALLLAFRSRHRLGIEEVAVDHDAVVELAAETGLTAYGACYLWLAQRLGATLVTLDRQLAAAWGGQ